MANNMQAVVPAAGLGTRLSSISERIPKPMIRVNGKPILEYIMDDISSYDDIYGITEVIVIVGYKKQQVMDYFGNAFRNLDIKYAIQETPRGLAHAVSCAADLINGSFLLRLGDEIFRGNSEDVLRTYQKSNLDGVILIESVELEEAKKFATVHSTDEGEVVRVNEKPTDPDTNVVETGCYVFPEEMADVCGNIDISCERNEYDLQTATNALIRSGFKFSTVPLEGWRININTIEDVRKAKQQLSQD